MFGGTGIQDREDGFETSDGWLSYAVDLEGAVCLAKVGSTLEMEVEVSMTGAAGKVVSLEDETTIEHASLTIAYDGVFALCPKLSTHLAEAIRAEEIGSWATGRGGRC